MEELKSLYQILSENKKSRCHLYVHPFLFTRNQTHQHAGFYTPFKKYFESVHFSLPPSLHLDQTTMIPHGLWNRLLASCFHLCATHFHLEATAILKCKAHHLPSLLVIDFPKNLEQIHLPIWPARPPTTGPACFLVSVPASPSCPIHTGYTAS